MKKESLGVDMTTSPHALTHWLIWKGKKSEL
jgi:hypothetical protein